MTFATLAALVERNANTRTGSWSAPCCFSSSPAFCETRTSAASATGRSGGLRGSAWRPRRRGNRPGLVEEDRLGAVSFHGRPAACGRTGRPGRAGPSDSRRRRRSLQVVVAVVRQASARPACTPWSSSRDASRPATDGAKHSRASGIPRNRLHHRAGVLQAGVVGLLQVGDDPAEAGPVVAATAPTAWIIADSRSSLIRGSSSRSVSVAMVRFSDKSSPNENGSSSRGAAEVSGGAPGLGALLLQELHQRLRVALRVDHRHRGAAQREL